MFVVQICDLPGVSKESEAYCFANPCYLPELHARQCAMRLGALCGSPKLHSASALWSPVSLETGVCLLSKAT